MGDAAPRRTPDQSSASTQGDFAAIIRMSERSFTRVATGGRSMLLSYSKLNTYQQCPLRYRFTYLDRLPRRPRRLFRTAKRVHHALMSWLVYARSGQPSLSEALRTYE